MSVGRHVFVGDVHGCLDELDELVALVSLAPGDRIVFVGDLVDRGPDTIGVVRRVRELLARYPGSACVAGNHEESALRRRDRGEAGRKAAPAPPAEPRPPPHGTSRGEALHSPRERVGRATEGGAGGGSAAGGHERDLAQRGPASPRERAERATEGEQAWAALASPDDWAFLDGLPLVWRDARLGAVVVHGGFFPRFFELHGAVGDVSPTWRRDRGKHADRLRRFLRTRRVGRDGEMLALDQARPEDPHWCEGYDGREGYCFFGHDPQLAPPAPLRAPFALGLDTGCCFGGRLTAAVVREGGPFAGAELVSVPARAQYAPPRFVGSLLRP